MTARPRLVLLALAAIQVTVASPPGRALARLPSPDCTDGEISTLDVTRIGEVIEDGVGYGGIRIGDAESALLATWGPTSCRPAGQGGVRVYVAQRDADQAMEMVAVRTRAGLVDAMTIAAVPHGGLDRAIRLTMREGIHVGMTLGDVERSYGPPEDRMDPVLLYRSRGIA